MTDETRFLEGKDFELKCSKCGSNNTTLHYTILSRMVPGFRNTEIYATPIIGLLCLNCKHETIISEREHLIGNLS